MLPKLMRRRGLAPVVLAFDDSERDRGAALVVLLLPPLLRCPAALRPADMAAQAPFAAAAYQRPIHGLRRRIGGKRGGRKGERKGHGDERFADQEILRARPPQTCGPCGAESIATAIRRKGAGMSRTEGVSRDGSATRAPLARTTWDLADGEIGQGRFR